MTTIEFFFSHVFMFQFCFHYFIEWMGLTYQTVSKKEVQRLNVALEFRDRACESPRNRRRANEFFASLVDISANRCDWRFSPVRVSLESDVLDDEVRGSCRCFKDGHARIAIHYEFLRTFGEAQLRKTLAHELSHAHDPRCMFGKAPFWATWTQSPLRHLLYWYSPAEVRARSHAHDFDGVGTSEDWANLAYVLSMHTGFPGDDPITNELT